MTPTMADYPYHRQAVQALRAGGARICEVDDRFDCEVRSTLRAMGVSRKRGMRRILNSRATIYQRLLLPDGTWMFMTNAEINGLLDLWYGAPEQQRYCLRFVHQKHGKNRLYLDWSQLAIVCGGCSNHPIVMAWILWYLNDFMPAIHAHGYYNPATNHEPPPTELLDALERRERAHDMLAQNFQDFRDVESAQTDERNVDDLSEWDRGDHRDW